MDVNILKKILKIESNNKKIGFVPTIFCFNSKQDIIASKGKCFSNIDYFFNLNSDEFSHFTPNIYKEGFISKKSKIFGYSEKNLYQINSFVVDIDSKEVYYKDIAKILEKINLSPNLIIDTPKGYHLYYILKKPIYEKHFSVAKKASIKIREQISKKINNVDMGCNHFGIFRYPNNILFKNLDNLYLLEDFKYLLTDKKSNIKTNYTGYRQMDAFWFKLLKNVRNSKRKDYMCGRNNLLFTLALACFASNIDYKFAVIKLNIFNKNLDYPLDDTEFIKTIKSAYSGKYRAASIPHIKRLISFYRPEYKNNKAIYWYKNKKQRNEREKSYIYEWREDFIKWYKNYINNNSEKSIKLTLNDISNKTGIPLSSLKILLDKMQKSGEIYKQTKRGKYGFTIICYLPIFFKYILESKNESIKNQNVWFENIRKHLLKNQDFQSIINKIKITNDIIQLVRPKLKN